jgi:LuxR family maltose regulon positive regulatory protein
LVGYQLIAPTAKARIWATASAGGSWPASNWWTMRTGASNLVAGHAALARVKQARGDLEGAIQTIDEAGRIAEKSGVDPLIALAGLHRARLQLATGAAVSALKWAQRSGLAAADAVRYPREDEYLTLARILIEQPRHSPVMGDPNDVTSLLGRLLDSAEKAGRWGSVIEILILQALSRPQDSLAPLRRALSLAEPEGYARLFVDEGPPMAELLRAAAQRGALPDYVGRLLALFSTAPSAARAPDALTEREVEILRLVAAGLPNQEIANRLVVSLSTVKTHITHVYSKRGAANRIQAVARARELKLL